MYTIVFEEDELKELDLFVNGNFSMEGIFDYMSRTGMGYEESIAFLTALNKIDKAAKKVREDALERGGD